MKNVGPLYAKGTHIDMDHYIEAGQVGRVRLYFEGDFIGYSTVIRAGSASGPTVSSLHYDSSDHFKLEGYLTGKEYSIVYERTSNSSDPSYYPGGSLSRVSFSDLALSPATFKTVKATALTVPSA